MHSNLSVTYRGVVVPEYIWAVVVEDDFALWANGVDAALNTTTNSEPGEFNENVVAYQLREIVDRAGDVWRELEPDCFYLHDFMGETAEERAADGVDSRSMEEIRLFHGIKEVRPRV